MSEKKKHVPIAPPALEPTVPVGTYDRYKDKRINDQDLIDHKVAPPPAQDITTHMGLTMQNVGAYLARARDMGKVMEQAQTLGDFPDGEHARGVATVMFMDAVQDLHEARTKLDDLLKEAFVTYRQKEGSVLHVERSEPEDFSVH